MSRFIDRYAGLGSQRPDPAQRDADMRRAAAATGDPAVIEAVERAIAAADKPRELLDCGCYVWEHAGSKRCPS